MKARLLITLILSLFAFQVHADPGSDLLQGTRRLKIAFVIDSYDQQKSGAIVSANRFLQELRKIHDITIVSTGEEESNKVAVGSFYFPFAKKIMQRNGIVFGKAHRKDLVKAFEGKDLVYVHFPFLLGIKAMKIAKEMQLPTVVGFHIQPENMLMNAHINNKFLAKNLYNIFARKFYNLADIVICPSVFAEKLLRANKYFNAKTIVISNGLTDEFRPRPTADRFTRPNGMFTILTVGRLAKEKRHVDIIDAIAKSKYKDHIQLVITGDGALKDKIAAHASKLPVPVKIGYVTKEELFRLYNSSDLYIHASDIELEGMSVLEAIGCGMTALISDSNSSASSQFALTPDFLFERGNSDQLAAKIDYWYEHPEELRVRSDEYAESAKAYYFERSFQTMNDIFLRAADRAI